MKAFLGNQLNEDGIQFRWVAPTDLYFDVGVEFGRGRQFPSGVDRNKNGFGSTNFFTHLDGDIGPRLAPQTGLAHLRTSQQVRTFGDVDSAGTAVTNSFTGKS